MPRCGATFDENNVPLGQRGTSGVGSGLSGRLSRLRLPPKSTHQKVAIFLVGSYFPLGEYFIRTSTTGLPAAGVVTLPARMSTASICLP